MIDRRKNERVPRRMKIIFIHEDDYLISYSRNLSVDGMYLYTPDPPDYGDIIDIRFALSEEEQIAARAKVMWVHPGSDSEDSGVGVQFLELPHDSQTSIRKAVRRIAVLDTDGLPVQGG